jgi:hypothetical protein
METFVKKIDSSICHMESVGDRHDNMVGWVGVDFVFPKYKFIKFEYPRIHPHPHFKWRKKVEFQTHTQRGSDIPMGFGYPRLSSLHMNLCCILIFFI